MPRCITVSDRSAAVSSTLGHLKVVDVGDGAGERRVSKLNEKCSNSP